MNIPVANFDTAEASPAVSLQEIDLRESACFPTMIYSLDLPNAEDVNAHLLEAIYAERERDRKGIERSNFSKLGGWHSHNNLHKEAEFQDLVDQIDAASAKVSAENGYHDRYKLSIGTMWSIINAPGSSNRAHIHPRSFWSGVYYVHVPESSGDIEFIDPRTQNLMQPPRYVPNKQRPRQCWTKVVYTPRPGMMLMFPSWLYHAVTPNLSTGKGRDGDRVILSFNLGQAKI